MAILTDSSLTDAPSYAELRARTHYSFLRGASHPAELIEQAASLGLRGLAITDLNGVYGMPKAYLASQAHPSLKLIVGADLTLEGGSLLTLLARDRAAYGVLCRLITTAHAGKEKGQASLSWSELWEHGSRPGFTGLIALPDLETPWSAQRLEQLWGGFGTERLLIPLHRFLDGRDKARTARALELEKRFSARIVATNAVHFHVPERKRLQDVLSCIREGRKLKDAGSLLFPNAERTLRAPALMRKLYRDLPRALTHTLEVAESCVFSPSELRYRYPSEWIPQGESAQSYLEKLTWQGAARRYPQGIPENVAAQLRHEFALIQELQFADYFLTIWEIIEFARERRILCQGRGAAANSAVCYCLGITAVDPVRMNLLFERFLSAERGEPPDIDVDFEHERREEVLQHVYEKYGRDRAAMVAAVITYRSRSALREVSKVFGEEAGQASAQNLIEDIKGFPRHLSIHSGGFTLSADPIIETVPVEPARMEGRTIVQWDKYDLDALGLLKVDLLSLGMLSAIRKTLDQVGLELATIPAEDPKTYQMIREADTVGVFQIESRAQMSMLPRLLPETFYDLVVEVALVRPGPIVGKMVHPYLRRRRGLEPATLPDPRLEPILGRTLGVPLFQEQVMKMAITLAEFTPGEADQLRRAIGAWRSSGSIDKMGKRLMEGLLKSGIPQDYADLIFTQIQGFAEYGFPESHAASFALLAYASSYLKCHHPAEFTAALLNSQPMGFYAPHTLVDDAKRHGVRVLPLDLERSLWHCESGPGWLRLGFCYVHGMSEREGQELLHARKERPFASLADFLSRTRLRQNVLHQLALGDAFACFGYDSRHALWEILARGAAQRDLFSFLEEDAGETRKKGLFEELGSAERIRLDYSVYGLSTRGHPMQEIRRQLEGMRRFPRMTTRQARETPAGRLIRIPGLSIVIQRPPTASGTAFATLEDEHGFLDLILHRDVFQAHRELILEHCFLIVSGIIQRDGKAVSLIVKRLEPFLVDQPLNILSRIG